jgi:AraC family transcriptional regulator
MGSFARQGLLVPELPYWTTKERLDDHASLSSATFAHGDLSVARYRRDRPGLGVTTPNSNSAIFMAVVALRPLPAHCGWHNTNAIKMPSLPTGSLVSFDLRESWSSNLTDPFDTFNAYIPLAAFDEITSQLKRPTIERLSCNSKAPVHDETMLGLAQSLNSLMARPNEVTSLFLDHILAALVTHLAVHYGGLGDTSGLLGNDAKRCGALTRSQQQRVKSRIVDDLKDDPNLSELASLCDMSRSRFIRAFRQTTGMPPHQWVLMQRVNRARDLLATTKMSISEIALQCRFADQSHLTRVFSKVFGKPPGAFRHDVRD